MPSPEYTWNARTGRYVDARGRFVSRDSVQRSLQQAIANTRAKAQALTARLRSGDASLVEWEQGMRRLVKNVHLYSAANARGGWAQMTAEDWGHVGPTVRFHYGKLHQFAQQLGAGLVMDGRVTSRVDMYMLAGRSSYDDQDFRLQRDKLGRTEERNVLVAAEHCAGCVEQSARLWVSIGTLTRPGTRDCLSRCRCWVEYR